ncbi:MAG: HAMP domain-containing histidine kinase [Leptolyngbyaceae cyanobacterium SL_5_9]|nr:HAMP domain-containing histidine kinase [Leptolyngbyaceae cyanobacterium SL_5_9]NJO76023.1 HAMP domain-containing histidine kinase [Leptolyngbyaceae cyanobacterium RM1_406_9]
MDHVADRQNKELKDLSQLKDDFLSTVSHELRSPMTNIKMVTQMLRLLFQQDESNGDGNTQFFAETQEQALFKAKVNRYLLILEQECDREINLLTTFLDLQQLDTGKYSSDQTAVDLKELIPQVIKPFLRYAKDRQQTLDLEIAADLSVVTIDQASLTRIVIELLTNACKFTPTGEMIAVTLSLKLTPVNSARILQLQVINSGVEILEGDRSQIFDRFYRIPNGDRWKHNGIGLGLTLVKKLSEHLGGSIVVESGNGQTCFTVKIPINS